MIEKQIVFGNDGRIKLKRGIDILAEAVSSTLGASGKTVIIEDQFGNPHITKDGVTVANSILLSDPVENLGCSILKQASQKTASEAGDGTTTSCVIAKSIIDKCFNQIDDIENVTQAKEGIEYAAREVVKTLEKMKTVVTDEKLLQVATISANGDEYLGKMIADAYLTVGKDGVVTMDESSTGLDYTEVTNGTKIQRGYGTPFSVNNLRSKSVEYQNPLIVISNMKIDMHEKLHFAFEQSIKQKRPLLIISELDDRVKLFVAQNINKKNLTANFLDPEGIGLKRFELLEDLCLMTGAKMISEMSGDSSQNINADYLGTCRQMISNSTETILVFDEEENNKKNEVIEWLNNEIKLTANRSDKWHLQDRLSKLAGGVATIKIAGNSEVELKEKKDRVDDSIHATKAALEEGIVAGGGVALLDVHEKISKKTLGNRSTSFLIGYKMLIESLPSAWNKIVTNSGLSLDDESLKKQMSNRKLRQGIDVKSRKFGNMIKMGIIDPFKVTKNAILNSASVASIILTTSCVISNKRIKKDESSR
jgi:chaperonin GroEL